MSLKKVTNNDKELMTTLTRLVFNEFDLNVDVKTKSRDRIIVDAKNIIVYFFKKMTGLSFQKLTEITPIINRKISANRHGFQCVLNLIEQSKTFNEKIKLIEKIISVSTEIPNEYKKKYFKKINNQLVDVFFTKKGELMILLPINKLLVCLDCPTNKSIIGKTFNIDKENLKPMKYKLEFSPLNGNFFFEEFIKYNKLNNNG